VVVSSPEVLRIPVPYRKRPFLLALVLDDVDKDPIDGDRVGSEDDFLRIEPKLRNRRKRTAMPHAFEAVHNLKHCFGRQGLDGREGTDEGQRIGLRPTVRASHIGEIAIGDVLQTPGYT